MKKNATNIHMQLYENIHMLLYNIFYLYNNFIYPVVIYRYTFIYSFANIHY